MPREKYKYFDMFAFSEVPSPEFWKNQAKFVIGKVVYSARARKYQKLAADAEVIDFQQTLTLTVPKCCSIGCNSRHKPLGW